MIIRNYQDSDFATVIRLWWDSWHSSSGYQHPKAITDWQRRWHQLLPTHKVVVVEQQSQLVAFAALDAQHCVLAQLFVAPNWKHQGIGTRLMQWVSLQCPQGFTLRTAATNQESRVFYENLGLVEVGCDINEFNGREEVQYATHSSFTGWAHEQ
ncbi:MAG: GNAT family N-acetyltransferase [Leptolyngbya sp. SIOISBB]|nr:GNAT family N-acetyltransferase [Leptolyngbya sp. SIOISBB]